LSLLLLPCLAGCAAVGVAQLESMLAEQESATAVLSEWCAARHIADPPSITAQRVRSEEAPTSEAVRHALRAAPGEAIGYRHVRLNCGPATLSVAQNWYRRALLTPEMNRALDTGDTPFGRVVAPLHFTRERMTSERGAAEGCPPETVLSQRAMLSLPDGRPLSLLVECYTRANLQR
jgi:hypothetical protein